MAYQVNKFNGTFLVSVADGTIDSTTNIRFVGKNYAGYGQVQNENFLHLLEHFAGANQPSKPISGQLWYDSTDRKIKVYDGTRFRSVGGATSSATAPIGLSAGEFWFDSLAQQLYCWTGTEYVLVGPESPGTLGETSLTSVTVKDTGNESHTIAKIKSGGTDIAIFSKDTFNLSDADKTLLPNFGRIKKGITLVSTDNDNGVTTTASSAVIWGTATSAQRLVDINDSSIFYNINDFVLKDSPTFTTPVTFNSGFILGSVPRAAIEISDGSDLLLRTYSTDSKIILSPAGSSANGVLQIDNEFIVPAAGVSLGNDLNRFFQVFSNTVTATSMVGAFFGNLTGNVTGNVVGNVTGNVVGNVTGNLTGNITGTASSATNAIRLNNAEASDAAVISTVALRTASGNLVANQFVGTADRADRIKIDNSASDNPASSYKSAMTTQTPLTIAARDSSGDITARIFRGTATAVQGADLAEKYLADKEYEVGTVVIVGGEAEVTASVWVGQRAVGVVSGAPGLMMNQDLESGTYIALKGRVPVRVIGQVRKGDRLVAAPDGCAMASEDANANTFAVALESSLNTEVKLIEAIVL
jgi:hypothetical protein